jgi:MFS family permease
VSTEQSAVPEVAGGQLGVLATWRATPRQAKALLAGVLVSKLAGFLQLFLVLFLTHRGFSSERAGLALGLYGAGAVVGTLAGGAISDRISPRTTTLISMVGTAGLLISIAYLRNYYLILAAVVLVSAVGQLYRPAAQSMITQLTPADRLVMVTAMYRLSLNLGATAAPLIGVALVQVSYGLLFWLEAAASLAFALIALNLLPRGSKVDEAVATQGRAGAEPDHGYGPLLRDHRYLVFLLGFFLMCVVYAQWAAALPLAIVDAELSLWWYGAVVTLNALVVVLLEVWATKFTQRWPLRLTQLSGFVLLGIGYGVYAIKMVPALLILGTLIWTLSEITGAPTIWAYPGMVAPAHLRGRYFGVMQSMYGLGSTIGPILGVLLFTHVHQQVFVWAALVELLAALVGSIGMRAPGKAVASPAFVGPKPEPAG